MFSPPAALQPALNTVAALALRCGLAVPFFLSGLTKWDGPFQISQGALFLFKEEFRLHLLGAEIPYPFPVLMAHLSGAMEILLPVLLVLGLGTRLVALALLGMIAVIQITVPDGWAQFHLPWAAMALALIAHGGGPISLDGLISRARGQ